MPQLQLPIFPPDTIEISQCISFKKEAGNVTYFNGSLPIFSHDEKDVKAFRVITSQLYINGLVSQSEIVKAFGVTDTSVKRAVKLYRAQGIGGFYKPRHTRGPAVLTESVIMELQEHLNQGATIAEVAQQFSLKRDTLLKAARAGRLHVIEKKT
jgi:transposase-like protein